MLNEHKEGWIPHKKRSLKPTDTNLSSDGSLNLRKVGSI